MLFLTLQHPFHQHRVGGHRHVGQVSCGHVTSFGQGNGSKYPCWFLAKASRASPHCAPCSPFTNAAQTIPMVKAPLMEVLESEHVTQSLQLSHFSRQRCLSHSGITLPTLTSYNYSEHIRIFNCYILEREGSL